MCRYGHKCRFAHGIHELRDRARDPKYKTQNCKNFVLTGKCSYGSRCTFLHAMPPPPAHQFPWPDSAAYEYATSPHSLPSAGGSVPTPPQKSPSYMNAPPTYGYDPKIRSPGSGPTHAPVAPSPLYYSDSGSMLPPAKDYAPPHNRYDMSPPPYTAGASYPHPTHPGPAAGGAGSSPLLPPHPGHSRGRRTGVPPLELDISDSMHPMDPARRYIPSTSTLGSPNTTLSLHSPHQTAGLSPGGPAAAANRTWQQQQQSPQQHRNTMHPYARQEDLGIGTYNYPNPEVPNGSPWSGPSTSEMPPYPVRMRHSATEEGISGECILQSKSAEYDSVVAHSMVHSIARPSIIPPAGHFDAAGTSPHLFETNDSPISAQYSPSMPNTTGGGHAPLSSGVGAGGLNSASSHGAYPAMQGPYSDWNGSPHMVQKSSSGGMAQAYSATAAAHSPSHMSPHPSPHLSTHTSPRPNTHSNPHPPHHPNSHPNSHVSYPYPLHRGGSAFFCPPARS